MSFFRRANFGSRSLFGSRGSSSGKRLGSASGRDLRCRRLQLEPLEDRTLLSVGVSGMVWNDLNSDGVRSTDEPGIAGAVAEVFSSTDDVAGNADDVSLGTAVTDANGQYSFADLPDSPNFYVVFRTPVGYEFTAQHAGGDDALDSDADSVGATSLFAVAQDTTVVDIDAGLIGALPDFGWALNTGAANEKSWGVAVTTDAAGNVYVAGYFGGTADFDSGPGVYNLTSTDAIDIVVAEYSPVGALVWARSIDGEGLEDVVSGIAVDAQGSVFMAGSFEGTADFDPGSGIANLTSAGDTDAFVCKLDSAGNYLWAKQFGGDQADNASGIALGPDGTVYTTGGFLGTVDFDPGPNEYLLAQNNSQTIYIVKLDSAGDFVWAGSIGGAETQYSNGIAVADDGSVYTTGGFGGTADFDPGPAEFLLSYNHSPGYGIVDSAASLCKWDSDGNFVWANQWSLTDSTAGKAIDVAPDGSIYVTGTKQLVQFGSVILTDISSNLYAVKFDAAGNNIWTVVTTNIYHLDGSSLHGGATYGEAIAVDADGNAFITGTFMGSPDFDPNTGQFHLDGSLDDSYLLKLDSGGNFVWAKPVDAEWIRPAVGSNGDVYLTGILSGLLSDTSDLNPGPGEYILTSTSDRNILVSKILSFSGPTDVSLSSNSIDDGQPAGTVVGILATIDDEPSATFTYSLVSGAGGDDNAAFAIVGNELQTTAVFDAAAKNSYSIRVRSTDYAGQYVEQEFVISVIDVTPPTITLNAPAITNDDTPSVTVTATEGDGVLLDVDLNHDGDFDDAGEMGYATAALVDGSATFDVDPALAEGTYNLRARVADAAGNEGASDLAQMVVDTTPPTIFISPAVGGGDDNFKYFQVCYEDANLDSITLSAADVVLHVTGTANGTVVVGSGGYNDRNISIIDITGEGTISFSITSGTARDLAGNEAPAADLTFPILVPATHQIENVSVSEAETTLNPNGVLDSADTLLFSWTIRDLTDTAHVSLCIDNYHYAQIIGEPVSTSEGLYEYTTEYGPLSAGSHSFEIYYTSASHNFASFRGRFDVTEAVLAAPIISNVVVAEAGADSDLDGALESTDKLMITWSAVGEGGISAKSLTVDGESVAQINGPDGMDYSGVFGPLAAGDHQFTITVADANGVETEYSGTFNVATASPVATDVSNVVVAEAGTGSNRNGIKESTDKLVLTSREVGAAGVSARSLMIDDQSVTAIGGPNAAGCCYGIFGPLAAGEHTYVIQITDTDGVSVTESGTFDVTAPPAPEISNVIVAEAATGSNHNGTKESSDRLVITWRETSSAGIASRSLKIDDQTLAKIGGPDAAGCCYGVFGPLSSVNHTYTIDITDVNGVKSSVSGTFGVSSVSQPKISIANVVVAEAGIGSDHDYVRESTDKLVITWREFSDEAIVTRSLNIDGKTVAAIGGPDARGCCFSVLGQLSAGSHSYTIQLTDANGVSLTDSGTFAVADADSSGPQIGNVVVAEAAGLPRDGLLTSDETLVISWTLTDTDGIAAKSLSVDGANVSPIYRPLRQRILRPIGAIDAGNASLHHPGD